MAQHNLLFTGHMVDAPGRKEPRFPPETEPLVRRAMAAALHTLKGIYGTTLTGIAGGASGGDLLFHELCLENGIPSEIYLALPTSDFERESVSFAGTSWEKRFRHLLGVRPVEIMPETWGLEKTDNIWARANLWMLNRALENGGKNMILLALWNGKGGDGDGGTEHMIGMARNKHAEVKIIDITALE